MAELQREVTVSEVRIDTAEIPDHVRDDLAAATLDLIYSILRQTGGREQIELKKAELSAK